MSRSSLLGLCSILLLACSAESVAPGLVDSGVDIGDDTGGDDAADDGNAGDDGSGDGADSGLDPDAGDGSGGGLEVGELCLNNADCATSLCFRFDAAVEEGFCSEFCRDNADCPEGGFECLFLANSGGDFAQVCVPDDLCIDRDDDGFGVGPSCLGPDCDDAAAGVFLGADEVCDAIDNDCDGNIDEFVIDANAPCTTSFAGVCAAGRLYCIDGFPDCVPERTASSEICDGLDNDCNGEVDDGNPGGGITCTTGLGGVCAAGVTTCVDAALTCVAAAVPGDEPEICDGVDNDCDGSLDEGFENLGLPCFAGEGLCRRTGLSACDPADATAAPICGAEPGAPALFEVCDYADDDCDGVVDNGYVDALGRYEQVANCGGCGIDCNNLWPGGPDLYNVVPLCLPSGGTARCEFECAGDYIDADGVDENGCEFLPESDTVYVSTPTSGGRDGVTCGQWETPCATIGAATERARATGSARIRVATGVYRESVTLADGVSLLGGHNPLNWTRDADVNVTVISGTTTGGTSPDRVAVEASGITRPTELSGFTINGENAAAGGNSIAVRALNSTGALVIRDNRVFAGIGGTGTTGTAGGNGAEGRDGGAGVDRTVGLCSAATTAQGGAGGARSCSGTAAAGGDGGDSPRPVYTAQSGNGGAGSGAGAGTGGAGGWHMNGVSGTGGQTCNVFDVDEGRAGTRGSDASDAAGGAGASDNDGALDGALRWVGSSGATGVSGAAGSGGGGGGASGGIVASSTCYVGATGGGGGSGGCGGSGGAGGGAGGGSFAIFIAFASPPGSPDAMPQVYDNRLARNNGGTGGNGGNGGAGGAGGEGGAGGRTPGGQLFDFCLSQGAPGGLGGRGGHGGGGGGGAGGVSFDLFVYNAEGFDPGYTTNTFEIAASVTTSGRGGSGGSALNPTAGTGANGIGGASGTVFFAE